MLKNDSYSLSEGQFIDVMMYRGIVLLCYSQKDSKWLNYLIKNYINCLPPDHRENMKHFSDAHFYFIKNQFEKSLGYISIFKNNEFPIFKFDVKHISLKIYYELNSIDQAIYAIDAYKHFLNSPKVITEIFKNSYKNFIKIYEALFKIKSGKSKKDPSFIKARIEKEVHLALKPWLLEKADELIEKTKSYDKALKSC